MRTVEAAMLIAVLLVLAPSAAEARRRNRAERVLSALWNETQYEDARHDTEQLEGAERDRARDAARARYVAGKKRARKATSLEELMGEIRLSQQVYIYSHSDAAGK